VTAELRGVEARLLAAAEAAEWPPTPDLRAAVQARVEAVTPDLRGPVLERIAGTRPVPPARTIRRPLLRGLALALLAVVALAGVATALGYRLPGLDIVFVDTVPTAPPAGTSLDLGSPIPIGEALAGERPRVLLPAALPAPDTAWVAGAGDRRIVTLAWRAEPGQPTLENSDLSLVLMAVPGTSDGGFLVKGLGDETSVDDVSIDGEPGWWISGDVHEIRFLRPDGEAGLLPTRLAGDTLVFAHEGTLYRLETAFGRDATIAIAESLPLP
jgi:hypothetical protein